MLLTYKEILLLREKIWDIYNSDEYTSEYVGFVKNVKYILYLGEGGTTYGPLNLLSVNKLLSLVSPRIKSPNCTLKHSPYYSTCIEEYGLHYEATWENVCSKCEREIKRFINTNN